MPVPSDPKAEGSGRTDGEKPNGDLRTGSFKPLPTSERKTRKDVTFTSVVLFAAHNAIGLRRSFCDLKLYMKKQGKWSQIKAYNPVLMYGWNCGSEPCFPLPARQYTPGFRSRRLRQPRIHDRPGVPRRLRRSRELCRDVFRAAGIAHGTVTRTLTA